MTQNTSHAVMAQRFEAKDSLDDFPTPPWATRALIQYILIEKLRVSYELNCLEPACNRGYMTRPLREFFNEVKASDAFDYGDNEVRDFLKERYESQSFDWVITNPPFRLAEEFVLEALDVARQGVAILARTTFLESATRYYNLFGPCPPSIVAQFVERVPMVKGRLDKYASTATGYAWFVWGAKGNSETKLEWIPPCRKALELPSDYPPPVPLNSIFKN